MSQSRVILESLSPEIDGGKHFIKRIVGDQLVVEVDLFTDGHDVVNGHLLYRHDKERKWREVQLEHLGNDRWQGTFSLEKQGFYQYTVEGWVDHALNWQHEISRKIEADVDVKVELLDGIQYLDYVLDRANASENKFLESLKGLFQDPTQYQEAIQQAASQELKAIFLKYPEKRFAIRYVPVLKVWADREKAVFSSWYEFFPRSSSPEPGKHGTFKDCERLLPRVAELGFDTLYFPPVHPIGEVNRKGRNNAVNAEPGDVGSCWGIGSQHGGHKDLHPELGTADDFRSLIQKAKELGIEIAMDYALQCAPDHPYVEEHPAWFRWRPDGSVQYAENPPKKYQDILPIHFESEDWQNLWEELKSILLHWIGEGINVFRVDNPHTKPYRFWEWIINEIHKQHPDVIFLSEAFTRPKVMHELAKVGFTQSYTYYTWRNTKHELISYMEELTTSPGKYYFRPNFWPNTPDINPYILQDGNLIQFMIRYFLAATLSSNYGMYGPVYEQIVHAPVPNKEEYLDSEKYEVRHWDWEIENKLTSVIKLVNRFRKENPALQRTDNWIHCPLDNEQLFAYYKADSDRSNQLLIVVNLDPHYTQSGMVRMPFEAMGIQPGEHQFLMNDLMTGNAYTWDQEWNYVELNPQALPFHLFRIEKV